MENAWKCPSLHSYLIDIDAHILVSPEQISVAMAQLAPEYWWNSVKLRRCQTRYLGAELADLKGVTETWLWCTLWTWPVVRTDVSNHFETGTKQKCSLRMSEWLCAKKPPPDKANATGLVAFCCSLLAPAPGHWNNASKLSFEAWLPTSFQHLSTFQDRLNKSLVSARKCIHQSARVAIQMNTAPNHQNCQRAPRSFFGAVARDSHPLPRDPRDPLYMHRRHPGSWWLCPAEPHQGRARPQETRASALARPGGRPKMAEGWNLTETNRKNRKSKKKSRKSGRKSGRLGKQW